MTEDYIKLPCLYVDEELAEGRSFALTEDQAHYLRAVMRREAGDKVRVFNGRQGQWLAAIVTLDKKGCVVSPESLLRPQTPPGRAVHLIFAPIKKARLEDMISKAVELGVTDFHPVLTRHTENRHLNEDRIRAQVTEAAEQCERLTLPIWHDVTELPKLLGRWPATIPVVGALEREEGLPPLRSALPRGDVAFIIGPEGGFAQEEKDMIRRCKFVSPVHLGPRVLRSETAALVCLAAVLAEDLAP